MSRLGMTFGASLPGYRRLRKLAIRAVRRSPRLQKVVAARRSSASSRRPLGVRPGLAFPPGEARDLNIVVVVGLGLGADAAETTAHQLAQAALVTSTFRPVVVMDEAHFAPFRRLGLPVELVMSREMYARLHDSTGYSAYLSRRLTDVVSGYRAASVVPLARTGTADVAFDSLLALAATPR